MRVLGTMRGNSSYKVAPRMLIALLGISALISCAPALPPLHKNIENKNSRAAIDLIDENVDINAYDKRGNTPLHLAIKTQQVDVIEVLISAGADLNSRTIDGYSPVALGTRLGRPDIVKLLLAHGASIGDLPPGNSPLHEAIQENDEELAVLFIDSGSPLEHRDHEGKTPLFYAASRGNLEIIRRLLVAGANSNAYANDGRSPLHVAIFGGHNAAVDTLLASGAVVSGADKTELALYSSALLYEYVGHKSIDNGWYKKALHEFELSEHYYSRSYDAFSKKSNDLGDEVFETHLRNIAAVLVAGAQAQAQANLNDIGVGASAYNIRGTKELSRVKNSYIDLADVCRYKVVELNRLRERYSKNLDLQ